MCVCMCVCVCVCVCLCTRTRGRACVILKFHDLCFQSHHTHAHEHTLSRAHTHTGVPGLNCFLERAPARGQMKLESFSHRRPRCITVSKDAGTRRCVGFELKVRKRRPCLIDRDPKVENKKCADEADGIGRGAWILGLAWAIDDADVLRCLGQEFR